jgi:hypothetical protein
MLKSEQAQAELKKLKNEKWAVARIAAADGLQKEMRDTARSILGADGRARPTRRQDKEQQQILKLFLTMDEKARLQFFETMAPGLGVAIERGWQLLDRLPFQTGFGRKPFRAPKHPDVLIRRRVDWLLSLLGIVGPYQQNVAWFAAWAPHVAHYMAADTLGILLAAAIGGGGGEGEEVFQILCASGRNEHEIGGMGRHVTRALLTANRPDGWQFVENMLLAAQREEGLRQVILETCDEAHPQAFRRMLKLILDQNLERFSATVRAFDVWLGYQWGAPSGSVVSQTIEKMLLYLEDAAARDAAWRGKEAEQVYLALWAQAFDDAVAAVGPATELLKHSNAEHRFVAAHMLHQLGLVTSHKHLLAALEDADLRVATRALLAFHHGADSRVKDADLFERLEKLLPRCPERPEKLKPAVWPWTAYEISRELVADALPQNLGKREPTRLIPYLQQMGVSGRVAVIGLLGNQEKWNTETRNTLFALVGDASRGVREAAIQFLAKCQITPEEATGMEKLLDRKTGDLRRAVLTLLSRQTDTRALDSADRLLAGPSQPQRLAGLELLRLRVEEKRCAAEARARAEQYSAAHRKLNDAERQQIEVILAEETEAPTLANALGLISHEDRTWPPAPDSHGVQIQSAPARLLKKIFGSFQAVSSIQFHSLAAQRIVAALDELFKAHAQQVVSFKKPSGDIWKGLLSDLKYGFPKPDAKLPVDEDRERLPLAEVWENWWQTRQPELRDADGMELLRALAWFKFVYAPRHGPRATGQLFPEATKIIFGELPETERERHWEVASLLDWLLRFYPPAGGVEFSLDAAESALSLVPKECLQFTEQESAKLKELDASSKTSHVVVVDWHTYQARMAVVKTKNDWREVYSPFRIWPLVADALFGYAPQIWTPAQQARQWKLLRWMDEPVRPQERGGDSGVSASRCLPRQRTGLVELCQARAAGGATDADVIEHLIGERGVEF